MTERVEIGDAVLYHGDCLEILPTLGDVDAVVTDPPYGIGEAAGKNKSRSKAAVARDYGNAEWDNSPCVAGVELAIGLSRWQVLFGGNYYLLPPTNCWLIWDKLNSGDFADCEMAWTNMKKAVRIIRHRWNGMIREGNEKRFHPTQKPLAVMQWCIGHLPDGTSTILDPFMGSGTTGCAAVQLGRKFIGIEIERKYFDIACERIAAAQTQGRLFEAKPEAKPQQESLLGDAA